MDQRRNEHLEEQLSAYLDGELTAEQRAEVEALLERDADARRRLAELRATVDAVKRLPRAEASDDLLEQLRSRMERRALLGEGEPATSIEETPVPMYRWVRWLSVAAVLALCTVTIYSIWPGPDTDLMTSSGKELALHEGRPEDQLSNQEGRADTSEEEKFRESALPKAPPARTDDKAPAGGAKREAPPEEAVAKIQVSKDNAKTEVALNGAARFGEMADQGDIGQAAGGGRSTFAGGPNEEPDGAMASAMPLGDQYRSRRKDAKLRGMKPEDSERLTVNGSISPPTPGQTTAAGLNYFAYDGVQGPASQPAIGLGAIYSQGQHVATIEYSYEGQEAGNIIDELQLQAQPLVVESDNDNVTPVLIVVNDPEALDALIERVDASPHQPTEVRLRPHTIATFGYSIDRTDDFGSSMASSPDTMPSANMPRAIEWGGYDRSHSYDRQHAVPRPTETDDRDGDSVMMETDGARTTTAPSDDNVRMGMPFAEIAAMPATSQPTSRPAGEVATSQPIEPHTLRLLILMEESATTTAPASTQPTDTAATQPSK